MNFRLSLNLVQSVFHPEALLSRSRVSMLTPTWSVWGQHWVRTSIGSQKQSNTWSTMLFPNSGWKHKHQKDAWLSQSHSAKIQTLPKAARVWDINIWQQRYPSTTLLYWMTLNGHIKYAHYWLNNNVWMKLSCPCCWCLNFYKGLVFPW